MVSLDVYFNLFPRDIVFKLNLSKLGARFYLICILS